jgi:molybdopterin molybdotransferase
MISEEEARKKILETVRSLPSRRLSLSQALGCFAAEDCFARLPLPAFDNSAMDGYAVVASSCAKGKRLRVTAEQPAGRDKQLHVSLGEAVRIFTGAAMPQGADAIVMQEDVTRDGDEIVINTEVTAGEFIRRRGCDLAEGQRILAKGERLRAATMALLASQGIWDLTVGGEVNAAILSTGDELVKPGEKLNPGQIYESNSALLRALLHRCGAAVNLLEHCRDERGSLSKAIKRGMKNHILVITGGVSVGEHDLVKDALRDLGAHIDIWRVAIKPGKPFLFGRMQPSKPSPQSSQRSARSRSRDADSMAPSKGAVASSDCCFVFGLPGNPVSAFVTFLQFVRPAILKMMGAINLDLLQLPARLTVDLTNQGDRAHYIRGKLEHGEFSPVGRQESHALFALSRSNALMRLGLGQSFRADEIVDVQIWD